MAHGTQATTRSADLDAVLAACAQNRERDLADLFRILRQPSISTQNIGVRECAELERDLLVDAGLKVRIVETEGHPIVFGERPGPAGAPTLLLYGHYDVQPPEPLDAWLSPPFEPEVRDGKIWARGVGDNKGQHVAHVCALRAWTLVGVYIFADYGSGNVWGLARDGSGAWQTSEPVETDLRVSSFSEDASGELYVTSFDGTVYRVVAP